MLLENSDIRQLKTDNHWLEKFLADKKVEEKPEENSEEQE